MTAPIDLSKLELHCTLRHMRNVHADLVERQERLSDRRLAHGSDTIAEAAILAVANEMFLVETIIAKLWHIYVTYGDPIKPGSEP